MTHRKLSSAVRYAQRLADQNGMRYTVIPAGPCYRVKLGAIRGLSFSIVLNPRG